MVKVAKCIFTASIRSPRNPRCSVQTPRTVFHPNVTAAHQRFTARASAPRARRVCCAFKSTCSRPPAPRCGSKGRKHYLFPAFFLSALWLVGSSPHYAITAARTRTHARTDWMDYLDVFAHKPHHIYNLRQRGELEPRARI